MPPKINFSVSLKWVHSSFYIQSWVLVFCHYIMMVFNVDPVRETSHGGKISCKFHVWQNSSWSMKLHNSLLLSNIFKKEWIHHFDFYIQLAIWKRNSDTTFLGGAHSFGDGPACPKISLEQNNKHFFNC